MHVVVGGNVNVKPRLFKCIFLVARMCFGPRFSLVARDEPFPSFFYSQALLVVVSGDRGLCGGYNNFVIKKARNVQQPNSRAIGRSHAGSRLCCNAGTLSCS